MATWLHRDPTGFALDLVVVPRASKTEWAGVHDDRLRLRVASPPVDGKANQAIVAALAKWAGVPKAAVAITSGETGRRKRVRLEPDDVEAALVALRATLTDAGVAWPAP